MTPELIFGLQWGSAVYPGEVNPNLPSDKPGRGYVVVK